MIRPLSPSQLKTEFPFLRAAGAADDPALSAAIGAVNAVDARQRGANWALTRCADINYNLNKPVTAIWALGDRPDPGNRLAPGERIVQSLAAGIDVTGPRTRDFSIEVWT
jgi:beta-glucosidase-like glycosyl hydrolase